MMLLNALWYNVDYAMNEESHMPLNCGYIFVLLMGAMHTYSAHGGAVCNYFTFGKR